MKIKYSVEYHKPSKRWVLWKTIEKEKSIGCRGVYKGTREECLKKLKELEDEQRRFQEKTNRKSNI